MVSHQANQLPVASLRIRSKKFAESVDRENQVVLDPDRFAHLARTCNVFR